MEGARLCIAVERSVATNEELFAGVVKNKEGHLTKMTFLNIFSKAKINNQRSESDSGLQIIVH